MPVISQLGAEGSKSILQALPVQITSAQIKALNATPIELVPAPGAGRAIIFFGILMSKPAGTAYAGIAGGEDLAVKYTDASGLQVASAETTGFLDQTSLQTRYAPVYSAASGDSSYTPVVNAALVLHLLSGEITTGDTALNCVVQYSIVDTLPFG